MACPQFSPLDSSAAIQSPNDFQSTAECFQDYLYARFNLSDATIVNYLGTIKRALPVIGIKPSAWTVERYFSKIRQSGASASYASYTAIALERYMDMIGAPMQLGRPPAPKRVLKHVLTEADITILIAATQNKRDRALMAVLAFSGIRNGELCKLTVDDVDIAGQTIHIAGKGAKERKSCISGQCVEAIVDYLNERKPNRDEYLFVTFRNKLPFEQQDLRKFLRKYAILAKIRKRVYPHLLRHSLATNLLLRGASLLTIAINSATNSLRALWSICTLLGRKCTGTTRISSRRICSPYH